MADSDEPLSEATLSLYLRKLVQDEIDRSFKLGLTGCRTEPVGSRATSHDKPVNGPAVPKSMRRD